LREAGVSRVIHRAPLAVTTDGTVRVNLATFDAPKHIDTLVKLAAAQPGAVFIGVALTPAEVAHLLDETRRLLPNITGPMAVRRQRRRSR
jgi:hypothetical protein